jgi:hypothetical protein
VSVIGHSNCGVAAGCQCSVPHSIVCLSVACVRILCGVILCALLFPAVHLVKNLPAVVLEFFTVLRICKL